LRTPSGSVAFYAFYSHVSPGFLPLQPLACLGPGLLGFSFRHGSLRLPSSLLKFRLVQLLFIIFTFVPQDLLFVRHFSFLDTLESNYLLFIPPLRLSSPVVPGVCTLGSPRSARWTAGDIIKTEPPLHIPSCLTSSSRPRFLSFYVLSRFPGLSLRNAYVLIALSAPTSPHFVRASSVFVSRCFVFRIGSLPLHLLRRRLLVLALLLGPFAQDDCSRFPLFHTMTHLPSFPLTLIVRNPRFSFLFGKGPLISQDGYFTSRFFLLHGLSCRSPPILTSPIKSAHLMVYSHKLPLSSKIPLFFRPCRQYLDFPP